MSKISNAILMLKILENGRVYKASDLAKRIECSERMIRTYKDELEKSGIYIETILGRNGGYYYNKINDSTDYFSLNLVELNELENLYLYLKEKQIDKDVNLKALIKLIEKVKFHLILDNDIDSKESVDVDHINSIYNTMIGAIDNKQCVLLMYKSGKRKKEIVFAPHNVYVYDDKYFVTGISKEKGEIRTFNFDSIIKSKKI